MKNKHELALKNLERSIIIKENEEGGLGITDVISVEVSVIDNNAQRASDMANELFRLLEEKAINVTQRESNLQIAFLKKQQAKNDSMLTSARDTLVLFQKANRIYDISSQAKLTVQAISQLEADKMTFELQKSYLQQTYSSQSLAVNAINDKIAIYNNKIAELEKKNNQSLTPGLQKSLDIADRFTDLYKEVETYFQLNISLRQQLEIAKIKQQKNYTGISLIDNAKPAEYKFKPKRSIIVLMITAIYMMTILAWVLFKEYYSAMRKTHPEIFDALLRAIR
jgi:capsule polysaccharide export protein KpsE/RkpR